jgi:hypothetical protein
MLELIHAAQTHAPEGSIVIVEAEETVDFDVIREGSQSQLDDWDVRSYAPAIVGLWRK